MDYIPNTELRLDDIPEATADWGLINDFAHTFDGYTEAGSLEHCAEIAQARRSETLTEIRICLFYEARKWRHYGDEPDEQELKYPQELVCKIRERVACGDLR